MENSKLTKAFEDGTIKGAWLLGDSGYALKPWLLTPILSPTTRAERKHSKAHKSTRCIIERTYGIWKMRIPFEYDETEEDEEDL